MFCGDLNALPNAPACRRLGKRLRNIDADRPNKARKGTFFGRFPVMRIDHIFVGSDIAVEKVEIPSSSLTRVPTQRTLAAA